MSKIRLPHHLKLTTYTKITKYSNKSSQSAKNMQPLSSPDATSSQTLLKSHINNHRTEEVKQTSFQFVATSSQKPSLSKPRLTSCLQRQTVKKYRSTVSLSSFLTPSNEITTKVELKQNSMAWNGNQKSWSCPQNKNKRIGWLDPRVAPWSH